MMTRKNFWVAAVVIGLLCSGLALAGKVKGWPVFKGAWFDIQYPPSFIAKPSLKTKLMVPDNEKGRTDFDSVFFISPDQTVEFYVFSPHSEGEASDIALDPAKEILSAEKIDKKAGKTVRWITIEAKDKSYLRSYVYTIDHDMMDSQQVFGIKYKNQESYNRYKSDYIKFKGTLVRYWHD